MADKKDNVESLAQRTNNGKLADPRQCLENCLKDVGQHGALRNGQKLLVLALDDTHGGYAVSWYQAGMKMSECLALCQVGKQCILNEMEYNVFPEDLP